MVPPNPARVLTWNIRAGGGNRINDIADAILSYRPDVTAITEYHNKTGSALGRRLTEGGLIYQASSDPPGSANGVFLASRWPFELETQQDHLAPTARCWLEAQFPEFRVGAAYFPMTGGKFHPFWTFILEEAERHKTEAYILLGDFNTTRSGPHYGHFFSLEMLGYVDAWRTTRGLRRGNYSWTNHNGTRTRIDYVFVSKPWAQQVRAARYDHCEAVARLSDHRPLVVDLGVASNKLGARMSRLASLGILRALAVIGRRASPRQY